MKNRLPMLFVLGFVFAFPALVSAQTYHAYFGDIHSHTWYSDGNQDQNPSTYTLPVARSMTYAKSSPSMNFLGISDHNHCCATSGFPMTLALWRSGVHEADSVNQDGVFACLYGQEWGTTATGGGHSLIYGTDKLYGWDPSTYDVFVPKNNFAALVTAVKNDNGFIYFAHPATDQFGNIFTSAYNAAWDSVVEGVAMRNGPSTSLNTSETDPGGTDYTARYHDLLKIGYHVAPCANQDNHNTTFGRVNQQRTAVIATSLTKANVIDALRNRRTYATTDHNIEVYFESGTHQMGEIYTTSGNVPLRVKVVDAGETFSSITIRYGVPGSGVAPTTLTTIAGKDSLIFSNPQPVNTTYYYYAYVVESDGQLAWSAPIWVTTVPAGAPPAAFNLTAPANNATAQPLSGTLSWAASSGATQYDVYLGTVSPGTIVSADQVGTSYNYSGLTASTPYFWKVVAKNATGNTDATGSPRTFTTNIAPPQAFTQTAPSNGSGGQPVLGTISWSTATDATAYDVYLSTTTPPTTIVSPDQPGASYNYSGLTNSTQYYWKIVAKNAGGSTTATGAPWNFTTIVGAPGAFTQTAPANGAIDRPVAGTLSWQTSPTATAYDVYLDTSANPSTNVSPDQAGTTYNYSGLANSTLYRWKIVAKNGSGTLAASNAPLSFTTIVPMPGAFALQLPANSAVNQPHAGNLTWSSSANAVGYDVYLDTLASPATVVSSDQAGTVYAYASLPGGTTYYWKVVAKNAAGNTPATTIPFQFTTSNLPTAPSLVVSSNVTTSALQLSWKDNAGDETGYRVFRSQSGGGPFIQVGSDLPANTVSFNDAGLSVNVRYYYRILPFNGLGEGDYASFNLATLAMPPGTPVLSEATYLTMRVTVNPDVDPPVTQFAVRMIADADTQYVQADGSVGSTPGWRNFEEWGSVSGSVVSGLHSCKDYSVAVLARNQDAFLSAYGATANQVLQCFSLSGNVESGWNLISVPVAVANPLKSAIFPTSTSSAFSYHSGYQVQDTIKQGIGYWLKFGASDPVFLEGEPATFDSIPVVSGWNIIGSVASSVSLGSIVEDPAGIVSSSFFGYNGAYAVTDSIYPLHAYWVKSNAPGKLVLSSFAAAPVAHARIQEESLPVSGTLVFTDEQGNAQTLTLLLSQRSGAEQAIAELPPRPPEGSFDVRFASQHTTEVVAREVGLETNLPIEMQSSSDVVEVSWNVAALKGVQLELSYGAKTIALSSSGSLKLPGDATLLALRGIASADGHLPTAFSLHQNFPNPFNPSTEIRYDLPVRSSVRMIVFNLLGVPVATLVNGEQEPGFHTVSWYPQVASGMYFYKMEAVNSADPTDTFQRIARMLYVK